MQVISRRFAYLYLAFSQFKAIFEPGSSPGTLRMFALNPKPRLKPRFVFDSASRGLGRALPVKRWNFLLRQEDWGYRELKPTFNRAQISAQWCRRISQRIFTPETRDSRLDELYAL